MRVAEAEGRGQCLKAINGGCHKSGWRTIESEQGVKKDASSSQGKDRCQPIRKRMARKS